ncbi:uncharacterized protein VTP21DRAFT_648 [Calcarisporiella thermophila]|uniref:uncharacterized protein n=1 Tax=Calcarisporiella thermophila TaxID=911321 RepID=UPI003744AD9B
MNASSSGLQRRRVAAPPTTEESRRPSEEEKEEEQPRFTIMEEVLLLGLKDKQGYLSFWNDNISYCLRGCILIELAFRGRIAMVPDPNRRRQPLAERFIEVINDESTGEVLLDEALKLMKASEYMSVMNWIDLMSGETWSVMKAGYQLKQVRERLAKGLVDKGVLRTEKRNFLLFDMATHPVNDFRVKEEIVNRVCSTLISPVEPDLRTAAMVCAAYAANVLENALVTLSYERREQALTRVDELLGDYSVWPMQGKAANRFLDKGGELCMEVVSAVLDVFTKVDSIL